MLLANCIRQLILSMQSSNAKEQIPGILEELTTLCDRIQSESKSTLIASVELSNDLYIAADECLASLQEGREELERLIQVFLGNTKNRITRQHITDQTFVISKVFKKLVLTGEEMHEFIQNKQSS